MKTLGHWSSLPLRHNTRVAPESNMYIFIIHHRQSRITDFKFYAAGQSHATRIPAQNYSKRYR